MADLRPTTRRGSRGEHVAHAHGILAAEGFQPGKLGSMRVFGNAMHHALVHFQETHLREDGQPLGVDGWIGEQTWWALEHPTGPKQALGLPKLVPDGLSDDRIRLLEIAHSYHGVREQPNGSNRSPQIDKWTRWTDARGRKGPPWCAYYTSSIWYELLGTWPLGGRWGSCYKSTVEARKRDMYVLKDPQPGDQFIMNFGFEGTGRPPRGHTGFVASVSADGLLVSTIEGNCANRCARRIRPVDSLAGFIQVLEPVASFQRELPEGVRMIGGESTR